VYNVLMDKKKLHTKKIRFEHEADNQELQSFLKSAKQGKLGIVEASSLRYSRISKQSGARIVHIGNYFYNVS
jgi:hypothetical protein